MALIDKPLLFLSKLLPLFVLPLGLAIVFAVVALLFARRSPVARVFVGLSILVLWIGSAPISAHWLGAGLESAYPATPIDQMPEADVAIILGGSVERIVEGWQLYRAGKVTTIVVSGGDIPWVIGPEADAAQMRRLLMEIGVPDDAIVAETESRKTRENAVNSAAIVRSRGWRSVLLVTSAAHMRRAVVAFARAGLAVAAAPTDFKSGGALSGSLLDFLPDGAALAETTSVLREWLGLFYYRVRGWA